jgi:Putative zinc-finger/Photosynthesis system II assembly factor YCF48
MAEIPKIVGQRMRTIVKLADHPDPNLLGAFVDRSLGNRERLEVLEHLSRCTDCREIVSLSANRPSNVDLVAVVGASPSWRSWPVLRWGAAMACVVVVVAAVTLRARHESRQAADMIAEAKPAAEMQLHVQNSPPVQNSALGMEKKAVSLQVPNAENKSALGAKPDASRQKAIPANPAAGNHAAANPSPVEVADAGTASPFPDLVPGRAKDALAESQADEGGSLAGQRSMVPLPSQAFFPENLVPRWTLSADGTLQRSLDSGRTWQTIPVSSQTIFRALSANGLDIWVGGTAGTLFHSSDAGLHWTQVRPVVNGEALVDDIIRVEFRDALHGKLTSSVEETWITADGGQTWEKQ